MSKDNKKPADKGSSSGKHKSEKGKSGEKSSTNKSLATAGKSSSSSKSTSSSGKSSSGSGKSSSGSSKNASKQSSGVTSSAKTTSSKSSKSIKLKEYKSTQAGKTSETSLGSPKSSEPNSKAEPGTILSKEKTFKETVKDLERKASNEPEAKSPVANSDKQQEQEPLKATEQPTKLKSNEKVKMDGNALATILSQNFRGGRSESVKLKVKRESLEKTTAKVENVHGSTFANNIDRDDSAMALVMHTARDEAEVKREETEIFCPGKGDLRSTQPDPTQEDSPKKEP